ncbi:MAG: hypothetical protein Q8907_11095 [Bacteroidota bacterium]|nr:hypothetical protein [Bacteroidota bacterium]
MKLKKAIEARLILFLAILLSSSWSLIVQTVIDEPAEIQKLPVNLQEPLPIPNTCIKAALSCDRAIAQMMLLNDM